MPAACRGFRNVYMHWSKHRNLTQNCNFLWQWFDLKSVELFPSHFPAAEFGKQNPTAESCPCSHIFLCYFSRIRHPYRHPGCEYTRGWIMWQKYRHLVQEGPGEKMLPPVHAAPPRHCQLKQHSSTASPSLGTHDATVNCVPCGAGNACAPGHRIKEPTVQGAAGVMSERSHS